MAKEYDLNRIINVQVKLGVILIGLAISGCAEVWGMDWKLLGANQRYSFYYDAESIIRSPENLIGVWTKAVYTDKGIIEIIKRMGKIYEDTDQSKGLVEYNCSKKMGRDLSLTFFSKGSVLGSSTSGIFKLSDKWGFIEPETFNDALYNAVCK